MLKPLLTTFALLHAGCVFASTDANLATLAELDAVPGISAALSQRIIGQRDKGVFADWSDLIARVHGIGSAAAASFSANGLTVNGKTFSGSNVPAAETSAAEPSPGSTKAY